METPFVPFTAALMAGGKSTRMGRDKATLKIDGAPLWWRQLETLQALAPAEVLISGRGDGPWVPAGVRTIADAQENVGPLGGLVAVLAQMTHERVVILAVDVPAMTSDFLRTLLAYGADGRGVVPMIDGRVEPLVAVYPRALLPLATDSLRRGELSLQCLVRAGVAAGVLDTHDVRREQRALFQNVNTPADLASLPCTRT